MSMFSQIIIYVMALQACPIFSYADDKCASSCELAYSQLENLCYDFTQQAGDYFSIQDIHQREGFFAVREASLYIAYNACGKVTRSIDNYRTGEVLEKDKITGGSGGSPSSTPGGSPTSTSSPSTMSTPPSTTSTPSSSSTTPSTSPTSSPSPGSSPPSPGGTTPP